MPIFQIRFQTLRRYWGFVDIEAATPQEAADKLRYEGPGGFDLEIDLEEPIGKEDDLWDAPIEYFNNPPGEWELIYNG